MIISAGRLGKFAGGSSDICILRAGAERLAGKPQ
jgi:hypothetical protein